MAAFPGGTARVIDRVVGATAIDYVIRVQPSDGTDPFDLRVTGTGTVADLKAKGKAAITAYLQSLNPPTDNVPPTGTLAVGADGTLS